MSDKKICTDEVAIDKILDRGTIVEILPTKLEFKKELLSGRRLKFYIGFDATAPTLHLSHAKNLMLLEKFRKLGHEVVVLFGDFTARIGDPSGESSARRQLSEKEVTENVAAWKTLIKPLMNFEDKYNPPKILYNNDWLSKLSAEEVFDLCRNFTVNQVLKRDMFQKRLHEGKDIYLHEFLYPVMQGYDSTAMNVDVELCGTDQIFNALVGRTLQKRINGVDKFVVAVTLMEDPKTGELMSKSNGTGIFLDVSANEMFKQVLSVTDAMVPVLFINNTNLELDEIEKIVSGNPNDAKLLLAQEIAKIFFTETEVREAQKIVSNNPS